MGARSAKWGLARSCATTAPLQFITGCLHAVTTWPAKHNRWQHRGSPRSLQNKRQGRKQNKRFWGPENGFFLGHACLPKHHSNCPTAQLLQPPLLPPQLSDPCFTPCGRISTSWHAWPLPLQGGQRRPCYLHWRLRWVAAIWYIAISSLQKSCKGHAAEYNGQLTNA